MFSKIVPAFTTENIAALGASSLSLPCLWLADDADQKNKPPGPLTLVALIYEALGILLAYIIRTFFWVPHRFRNGILIAGGWSNWGDIRTLPSHSLLSHDGS
jgi:auxin efflux carrier family protein